MLGTAYANLKREVCTTGAQPRKVEQTGSSVIRNLLCLKSIALATNVVLGEEYRVHSFDFSPLGEFKQVRYNHRVTIINCRVTPCQLKICMEVARPIAKFLGKCICDENTEGHPKRFLGSVDCTVL